MLLHTEAPRPSDVLYDNLFGMKAPDNPFERVAEGITASWRNADRLLSDVRHLVDGERLSSARFVLTTAREEIAKAYILVDACKLDVDKHEETLRRLCHAFYDHIQKHAYLRVVEHNNTHSWTLHSMTDVKTIWACAVHRWWQGSLEDSDPDMPHDTFFDRELPLYINFDEYSANWSVPSDSDQLLYFEEHPPNSFFSSSHPITKIHNLVERWRGADDAGILTPLVLQEMNAVFKKHYVSEKYTAEKLVRLYKKVAQQVLIKTGIAPDVLIDSVLVQWPLYCFPKNVKDYYSAQP